MKKIEAIIKPFKLDDVRERLTEVGIRGMTVLEVRGFGRAGGKASIYPGAEYIVDFVPKVKLEIVVPEELVHQAIEAIVEAAHTGHPGDGKIFVSTIDEAIRISTRETGPDALF
ncbi:MAG: P-II family nitrogen regulator [Myxococcota bacterium]